MDVMEKVVVIVVWLVESEWAAYRFPLNLVTVVIPEAIYTGLYERARRRAQALLDVRTFGCG